MLHELFLCLSGQSTAVLDSGFPNAKRIEESFPLFSHDEGNLLSPVHQIAQIHLALQSHAKRIASIHRSVVCRAVAAAILSSHLSSFQARVVDIERRILTNDSSVVGAYNIVPLSGITRELSEWLQIMEWYWRISQFMLPHQGQPSLQEIDAHGPCSGASIIDKLKTEARTGFPSIHDIALDLGKVAEMTWLRQLSAWILFGRLPEIGAHDFFIQVEREEDGSSSFSVNSKLLPKFVSALTASSILFVGRSRNHIRDLGSLRLSTPNPRSDTDVELHRAHLQSLAEVTAPVSPARLSDAVSSIRLSLSRNTLQKLLPLPRIIQLLSILQQFFLLDRGEFAIALIREADSRLKSRQKGQKSSRETTSITGVSAVLLKEGEITSILSRTWSTLSSYVGDDEVASEVLDFARDLMYLELRKSPLTRPSTPGRAREDADTLPTLSQVSFDDLLVHVPANLTMEIPSPLDLFITSSEVHIYSGLNSYLLAIRRSHVHLTDLWRGAGSRREHPAPLGPPHSNLAHGRRSLQEKRQRVKRRNADMREVWATCGAAVFLLSELINYFQGEIVQESCARFHRWVARPITQRVSEKADDISNATPHDPESLATAHRRFLSSLAHLILLTDVPYTKSLRALLTNLDLLIALIERLQTVRANVDLEEDEGVVDAMANYKQDERDIRAQLSRARRHVDANMKTIVARLRELDAERTGHGGLAFAARTDADGEEYLPLSRADLDGLLMKLDFGRAHSERDEDTDI